MNNFKIKMDLKQLEHMIYLYDCAYEKDEDNTDLYKSIVLMRLKNGRLIDHLTNVLIDLEHFKDTEVYSHYANDYIATCEVLDLVGCEYQETLDFLESTIKKAIEVSK